MLCPMNVKELIEELQKLPQDKQVSVWDPYHDEQTTEVYVGELGGKVIISEQAW